MSIPVEIFSATRTGAQISFRQIHEPSGQPIRYEKVVPDIGPVDVDDIVKGFEVAKGEYVLLDQKEIDAVKLESKRTLVLTQFVDYDSISVFYFDKPYFVVPSDELAEEAFIVLREALRRSGKVGVGQLSLRGREYIVTLKPCGRGMVLETLRYVDQVEKASHFFRDIPDRRPDAELLELANALIDKRSGDYDPRAFEDHYVDGLHRLIEKKRKARGKLVLEEKGDEAASGRKSNVIDLMAALKASVNGRSGSGGKSVSGKASPTATSNAREAHASTARSSRKTPVKAAGKTAGKTARKSARKTGTRKAATQKTAARRRSA